MLWGLRGARLRWRGAAGGRARTCARGYMPCRAGGLRRGAERWSWFEACFWGVFRAGTGCAGGLACEVALGCFLWMGFEWEAATRLWGGAWDACGALGGVLERAARPASDAKALVPASCVFAGTAPSLTAARIAAAKIARATMPSPRRIRRSVVFFAAASARGSPRAAETVLPA